MRFADLVSLYAHQSEMLQTYWTVYVVAIGGLLAVAALRREPDRLAAILATVLYIAFAYKNMSAICDVTQSRAAVTTVMQQLDAADAPQPEKPGIRAFQQTILPTLPVTDPGSIKRFHITCDVIVVVTLWGLQLRRRLAYRAALRAKTNAAMQV